MTDRTMTPTSPLRSSIAPISAGQRGFVQPGGGPARMEPPPGQATVSRKFGHLESHPEEIRGRHSLHREREAPDMTLANLKILIQLRNKYSKNRTRLQFTLDLANHGIWPGEIDPSLEADVNGAREWRTPFGRLVECRGVLSLEPL